MFQIDVLNKSFNWERWKELEEIEQVADELLEIMDLAPNISIRIQKDGRVLNFLRADEKNYRFFVETNIGTNRIANFDKQYEVYKKLENNNNKNDTAREKIYETVKVKGKIKKKSKNNKGKK